MTSVFGTRWRSLLLFPRRKNAVSHPCFTSFVFFSLCQHFLCVFIFHHNKVSDDSFHFCPIVLLFCFHLFSFLVNATSRRAEGAALLRLNSHYFRDSLRRTLVQIPFRPKYKNCNTSFTFFFTNFIQIVFFF